MQRFRFMYLAAEGDFLVSVFTGYYLYAKDHHSAMGLASRLDKYIFPNFELIVCFESDPKPHMSVGYCVEGKMAPQITKLEMTLPEFSELARIGELILRPEHHSELKEADFLVEMNNAHSSYFKRKNKSFITFELISYWVEAVENGSWVEMRQYL